MGTLRHWWENVRHWWENIRPWWENCRPWTGKYQTLMGKYQALKGKRQSLKGKRQALMRKWGNYQALMRNYQTLMGKYHPWWYKIGPWRGNVRPWWENLRPWWETIRHWWENMMPWWEMAGLEGEMAGLDGETPGLDEKISCLDERISDIDDRMSGLEGNWQTISGDLQGTGPLLMGKVRALKQKWQVVSLCYISSGIHGELHTLDYDFPGLDWERSVFPFHSSDFWGKKPHTPWEISVLQKGTTSPCRQMLAHSHLMVEKRGLGGDLSVLVLEPWDRHSEASDSCSQMLGLLQKESGLHRKLSSSEARMALLDGEMPDLQCDTWPQCGNANLSQTRGKLKMIKENVTPWREGLITLHLSGFTWATSFPRKPLGKDSHTRQKSWFIWEMADIDGETERSCRKLQGFTGNARRWLGNDFHSLENGDYLTMPPICQTKIEKWRTMIGKSGIHDELSGFHSRMIKRERFFRGLSEITLTHKS